MLEETNPQIPHFSIIKKIGSGANGVVYEAEDQLLGRSVAIKVWKQRGQSRAQLETSKIASLNHPLIVAMYFFGEISRQPYAIMELVQGISGKEWIKRDPAFDQRLGVWAMFVRALNHLHSTGIVHGDPHLGNVIVFPDLEEIHTPKDWRGEPGVAMKLTDTGTSEFWSDRAGFEKREAKLIVETATRIFQYEKLGDLTCDLDALGYAETLVVCDAAVKCTSLLNGYADRQRASMMADALVDLLLDAPFLDLNEILKRVRSSRTTDTGRVARRLNAALEDFRDILAANDTITERTQNLYLERRKLWQLDREKQKI